MGERDKQHRTNGRNPPGNAPRRSHVRQAPSEEKLKLFGHSIWLFQKSFLYLPRSSDAPGDLQLHIEL